MTIISLPNISKVESQTQPANGGSSWYISAWGGTKPTISSSDFFRTHRRESDYMIFKLNNIMLPFISYYRHGYYYENSNAFTNGGVYCYSFPNGYAFGPPNDVEVFQRVDAVARRVFYSKLSKHNDLNLAVSLVEMKETIGTVASVATRLGLAYRHLRRGRVGAAFDVLNLSPKKKLSKRDIQIAGLKTRRKGWNIGEHKKHIERMVPKSKRKLEKFAANTWLEIQYGWTPLVLDVYGMAKLIANLQHKSSYDVSVTAGGTEDVNEKRRNGDAAYIDNYVAHIKYKARLKVSNPNLRLAASLGLTNPLLVAWELVPFSFVVDWFVPIGQALEQYTLMHGYTVVDSSKTTFIKGRMYGWNEGRSQTTPLVSSTLNFHKLSREKGVLPQVILPSYNLKKALSISHLTTAISLLATSFLK